MPIPSPRMGLPVPEGTDIHNRTNFSNLILEIDDKSARRIDLNSHINNTANPHNVTTEQINTYTKQVIDSKDTAIQNSLNTHVGARNNPHAVTTEQINTYTKQVIDSKDTAIQSGLNTHTGNTNNPHNVTKAQVGLGSVDNFSTASQAEAQAGTVSNRFMTPLRVSEAIRSLATSGLVNLLNRDQFTANSPLSAFPRGITTMDVTVAGAGWPTQFGVVTTYKANDIRYGYQEVVGVVSVRRWYRILPADNVWGPWVEIATTNQVDNVQSNLNTHTGARNNPHGVTASQVGTYTTSQIDSKDTTIQSDLDSHKGATNNPHNVTKAQVGLGFVDNFSIASQLEAQVGTVNTRFMTPLRTKEAVDMHGNLTNNPHNVTKAQVGLGLVDNFSIATQAEAQAGTVSDRFMTPLRSKQLLDTHGNLTNNPHNVTASQVGTYTTAQIDSSISTITNNLSAHEALRNNPHNVTKSQVGLGSVDNNPTATQAEAQAGTVNTRFMTPLRSKQLLDTHGNLTNNPHNVTASQVGTYTTSQIDSKDTTIQNNLDAHTGARNNPHAVTKAQVGLGSVDNHGTATQAEAQAGTVNTRFMTPLRTAQAISSLATSNLVNRLNDNQFNSTANLSSYPLGISTMLVNIAGAGWPAQSSVVSTFNTNNTRFGYQEVVSVINDRKWYRRLTADNTWGNWQEIMTNSDINAVYNTIANHVNSTANPHSVTKAQVGLGLVLDYGVASQAQAQAGTINTAYMTPLRTKEAMDSYIASGSNSNGHWWKFDNGLLVCLSPYFDRLQTLEQLGAIFRTDAIEWIFPHEYIQHPSINFGIRRISGGPAWGLHNGGTDTQRVTGVRGASINNSTLMGWNLTAIGRWK